MGQLFETALETVIFVPMTLWKRCPTSERIAV